MKKNFIMLVMLFTMSVNIFAEDNNATEIERIERYSVKVNANKLSKYLDLSSDQMDAVENVTDEFSNDLMFAAVQDSEPSRSMITKNLIEKNVKYMSYILNKNQMRKYLTVLNATMNNRGILK